VFSISGRNHTSGACGTHSAFRSAVAQDSGTWARARGRALWKALITLADDIDTNETRAAVNRRVITEVLADAG
jgi:hypothetical protein